jgi:hypothetical protein
MTIARRTILLWLLMFWQGGFLFYGAVVITVGSDVLDSDFAQGMITRRVTAWINLTGLLALLAWTWDLFTEPQTRFLRRWAAWIFLVATLAWLAWLHPRMAALIDAEQARLIDDGAFRHLHRWYLRVSTAQIVACVAFTIWTLQNWRASDQKCEPSQAPE